MENQEYEIDLLEVFSAIWGRIVHVIAFSLICALIAGAISFFVMVPQYSSTAKLYIISKSTSITSLADIQVGSYLTSDYAELVKSRTVLEPVIAEMGLDEKYESLTNRVSVTNPDNTRLLYINVTDENPSMAKEMANTIAKEAQKQISEITKSDEPTVAEWAVENKKPISPNKTQNILLGFFIGFILISGYYAFRTIADNTIKTPEDVKKYLGLDTLGMIPVFEGSEDIENKQNKKKWFKKGAKSGGVK